MKLLYTVIIILAVLQLIQAKSSNDLDTLSPKKQLVRYYRKEFNLLAGEICIELKDISDRILKDKIVRRSNATILQEFKGNITQFNIIYPFYLRFGLNESLALTFANMITDYYNSQFSQSSTNNYILHLIKKLGYDEIRGKYKIELEKFYAEKFIPKFEKLRSEISNKSQLEKFEHKFLKCVDKSKECAEYECYLNNFRKNALKLKDQLVGNLQRQFLNKIVLYMHNVNELIIEVNKDPRVSQLSRPFRKELKERAHFSYEQIPFFEMVFKMGDFDVLKGYEMAYDSSMTPQQMQLLRDIFNDHGNEEISLGTHFNDLLEYFQKEVEHFKASFSQEELEEDTVFWEILKDINSSSSSKETAAALMKLDFLNENEIKKWKL